MHGSRTSALALPRCVVEPPLACTHMRACSARRLPCTLCTAGNFAGPVGAAAAYLLGLYDDQPEAAAVCGSSIWDIVPGA